MSVQAGPTTGGAIVGVVAVAAGVAAAAAVQPEKVIDWTLSKVSGVVVQTGYSADEHAPRNVLERGLRSASKAIDQAALTLQWKSNIMKFDDQSPIASSTLVRIAAGLLAFTIASSAIARAARA